MPKVSDTQEHALRRIIRDARALDPLISVRSLRDIVAQKSKRDVSLEYVWKLSKKVDGEIKIRPDQEKIDKRIAEMRENNRIVREGLLKIAYPPAGSLVQEKDKIKALEVIARIDHSQAKIEMDFGLYTRKLGEVEVKHTHEHRIVDPRIDAMMKAFENWGMAPPMRKLEAQRIEDIKQNEPTHNQPTAPAPATPNIIPVVTGAGLVPTE